MKIIEIRVTVDDDYVADLAEEIKDCIYHEFDSDGDIVDITYEIKEVKNEEV